MLKSKPKNLMETLYILEFLNVNYISSDIFDLILLFFNNNSYSSKTLEGMMISLRSPQLIRSKILLATI